MRTKKEIKSGSPIVSYVFESLTKEVTFGMEMLCPNCGKNYTISGIGFRYIPAVEEAEEEFSGSQ